MQLYSAPAYWQIFLLCKEFDAPVNRSRGRHTSETGSRPVGKRFLPKIKIGSSSNRVG